jgi:uncharacterized protein (DUF1800 family)
MTTATTRDASLAPRRRLFAALIASTAHAGAGSALARRRPGRDGQRGKDLPLAPSALTFPPAAVRWLTRCTFGFTVADLAAFNALGADDETRWQAWVERQLDPGAIDDGACEARIAGAGFSTLGKSATQLWIDHHEVGNDYALRMLPVAESECATVIRQTCSARQLYEVAVDFWHDHFSVFGWDYEGGPMFPAFDRDAIRPHALGNFRNLLEAVGKSASMMFMLDLYISDAAHPNENYARELMELHTLGAENYAGLVENPDSLANMEALGHFTAWDGEEERLKYVEDDVYEAARAMTGWTISGSVWPYDMIDGVPLGEFAYDNSRHDQGIERILARYFTAGTIEPQDDGMLLYDMLAQHPGTAHHVAGKLCRRLVGDAPPGELVQAAADVFHAQWDPAQHPDQLANVLRVILASDAFKSTWGTKMKRPGLAAVSALRATAADFTPKPDYPNGGWTTSEEFFYRLQAAGHRPFYWPAPNGYPDDQVAWSSTGTLGMTLRMLPRLLEMHAGTSDNYLAPFLCDVHAQTLAAFPDPAARSADNLVGYWCDRILGYRPEPLRGVVVDFLRQEAAPNAALDIVSDTNDDDGNPVHLGVWDTGHLSNHLTIARLRTAIALILCTPEFLRR